MTNQEIKYGAPSGGGTQHTDICIDITYLRWVLDEFECFRDRLIALQICVIELKSNKLTDKQMPPLRWLLYVN